jgi:hypothetical protein
LPASASRRHGLFSVQLSDRQSRKVTFFIAFDGPSVFQDPVPAVQRDRGMFGVSDPASDVDAGIPAHGATPLLVLIVFYP